MTWSQTYTGRVFYPLSPRVEDVEILDIAHALALCNRFGGHSRVPYSVAEHCVRVAAHLDYRIGLEGLLHDASEAYLGDMTRPLKHQPQMEEYRRAERLVEWTIAQRFGLVWPWPPEIKAADNRCLVTEARDLMMGPPPRPWSEIAEPWPERIIPWPWERAEAAFLEAFSYLSKDRPQP